MSMTKKYEDVLNKNLKMSILICYIELKQLMDIEQMSDFEGLKVFENMNKENIDEHCQYMNTEMIIRMTDMLDEIWNTSNAWDESNQLAFMLAYERCLLQAFNTLETIGLGPAFKELEILLDDGYIGSFHVACEVGLPCDELEQLVQEHFLDTSLGSVDELLPVVEHLVTEIVSSA